MNLGHAYRPERQYAKAREAYLASFESYKALNDREGQGKCLFFLGALYGSQGDLEKAREYLEASLAVYQELGHEQGQGENQYYLGILYEDQGHDEKARKSHEASLRCFEKLGHLDGQGKNLSSLIQQSVKLDQFAQTVDYLDQYLAIFKPVLGSDHPEILKIERGRREAQGKLDYLDFAEDSPTRTEPA